MPNFVENDTSLPFPKADLVAVPSGANPTKYVTAAEWNAVCQGLTDTKSVLRGAKWFGFTAQATDPAPGLAEYIWLKDDGNVYLTAGEITTRIGASTADGTTITGAGTAADPFVAARDFLSVKDFGAVGDGVNDDAAHLTSALTAAISQGKALWLPPGTYLLNSSVTIPTSTHLRIIGTNALLRYASTVRDCLIVSGTASRVHIEGLSFQGDANDEKYTNIYPAIHVTSGVSDLTVIDCRFETCSPLTSDDSSVSTRLRFLRCYVHNSPNGVHPTSDSVIEDCDFLHDTVVFTRAQAIYIYGQFTNCTVRNCRFKNLAEEDIQIRAGSARFDQRSIFKIEGCHFENSYQYSIWAGSDDHPDIGQMIISGNTFRNCQSPIQLQGCRSAVVTGNLLEWDWEYPYALPPISSHGIGVTKGVGLPGHYNTARGTIISNNKLIVRHPWVGKIVVDTLPTDGDTVTVGDFVYTWRTVATDPYDVAIAVNTTQCAQNLTLAIQGLDGRATAPCNVLRYVTDAFNNLYASSYNETDGNVVMVASSGNYTLVTTSVNITVTAPVDYRPACQQGILVNGCLTPVIVANQMDDMPCGVALQYNVQPQVIDNVLADQSGSAACISATGNVLPYYRGNRTPELNLLEPGRAYYSTIQDAFPVIDDNWLVTQQLCTTSLQGRAGLVTIGDGTAYTLFYYGAEIASPLNAATRPYRWDDGDQVRIWNGAGWTTFTFKRATPGAGEFNDATSLMVLINATSTWVASYEPVVNQLGASAPNMMIRISAAAIGTAGNVYQLRVVRYKDPSDSTTYSTVQQPLLNGIILRDRRNPDENAKFYGGAAARTTTFVHSPIANPSRGVFVQGADAASQALAPVVYAADIVPGVGFAITHAAGSGTESFFYRVN